MHGRPNQQIDNEAHSSHPDRWRVLTVLVLALLVTSVDHTIINVAMPRLVGDLGATAAQLQWVIAAYTVVFAGLLLTAGSLGDRFGRRHALIAGLATFLAGSVAAATSTSTTALILSRGVMGLGGALIMPTTLSILVNVFGSPRERAKAIAIWTAASGAGIALGPIAGGALMRSFSWSSVFWINVPLLVVALVGAVHLVPDSRDPHATRLDPVGAVLSITGTGSLVYGVVQAPSSGWTSGASLGWFGIGSAIAVLFVTWELRRRDPMLDMRLFSNRSFSAGSSTLALLFFAMAGTVFLQAQYLQFVLGYTPLAAGLALVPAALGMLFGTGAGAHLADQFGGRVAVTTGTFIAGAGVAVQAAFAHGGSYAPTGIGLLLFGLGAGIAMPPATDLIMATLPTARAGVGSAVNDTVRELGGALGVAVIGSIAATTYASTMRSRVGAIPGLTAADRRLVVDNVGAALDVSRHLGAHRSDVAATARSAFVDAMGTSLWVAVGLTAVATIVAAVYLPRHRADHVTVAPTSGVAHAHGHAHVHGHRTVPGGARVLVVGAIAVLILLTVTACGSGSSNAGSHGRTDATTAITAPTSTTVPPDLRPTDPVDELVRIEGGRLHVRCVGRGPETVVLMAGWGDAGDSWGRIEPSLERRARVCSYTKFGLGRSDRPARTQTFATQAEDVHALLARTGEPGPYVLVGHSFGGAQAVTFASLYPTEVDGLVLLDASPTSWITASCAVPDDGSEAARSFAMTCSMATHPDTNPEHLDAARGMAEVARITSLGSVPLTVLVASDHPRPGLNASEDRHLSSVQSTGAQRWAALSTRGRVTTVAHSGHYIQVDQPATVIHVVEALL